MRTIYQHAARRAAATHQYVAAVTPLGAEVRTLDEFFNRLIVVDRRIALIPGLSGRPGDPGTVWSWTYLVDIFERAWSAAGRSPKGLPADARHRRGAAVHDDPDADQGPRRPGQREAARGQPRTYAGYISDLKLEYDALTRFQLGYEMGRRGISGRGGPRRRQLGLAHEMSANTHPDVATRAVTRWSLPSFS